MRVGLVLDQFDPRQGGVEQWTRQFACGLLAAGHEVHVAASHFGPDERELGIVAHVLPPHRSRLARADAVERLLRPLRLDVIHDMGVGWYCDIFQPHGGSRIAAFEQNLRLAPAWLRPLKRHVARLLPRYRDFDTLAARQYADDGRIVLALSEMVERDLKQHHRVTDDRLRRIYNGVDTSRFSPQHRRTYRQAVRDQLGLRNEVLFLIVAHNFRLKGVPTLLTAMSRLAAQQRGVHLAIVGGKRLAPYQRLARRLATGNHVTFVGPVDDPVPYYAAADAYVQPTYYDPCSLVVLEALASGLPVVTSRFNGAAELMTPGRHGFVLQDPGDARELTELMSSLLDERSRKLMGGAARHLALQHSFEQNMERVLAVYDEVTARPMPRDTHWPVAPTRKRAA